MRGARLTILRLKGLVVLIAVMLASLMHSSEAVAACLQTGSLMVLLAAVLGAVFN